MPDIFTFKPFGDLQVIVSSFDMLFQHTVGVFQHIIASNR